MSALTCSQCGGLTNTTVCNYNYEFAEYSLRLVVRECYAKWNGTHWIRGYAMKKCELAYSHPFVDQLLLNKPNGSDILFTEGNDEDEG